MDATLLGVKARGRHRATDRQPSVPSTAAVDAGVPARLTEQDATDRQRDESREMAGSGSEELTGVRVDIGSGHCPAG